MKSRRNQIQFILRIIGTVLGTGILIYQIVSSIQNFSWANLPSNIIFNSIIALLLNIFAILIQMFAWKLVLAGIGHNVSMPSILSGFSTSFVSRYIPGTIWGYLARGEWLKREHNIPYSITNIGTLIEITGYIFSNLFIVILGYLLYARIGYGVLFFIAFLLLGWASVNILILWKPTHRLFHLNDNVTRFPLRHWVAIFLLFILLWCTYGFSLMIFGNGIGPQIGFSNFMHLSSIFSLAWFIGFIILFIPSGLGVRDYSLSIFLVAQYGLSRAIFSIIVVGFRGLTFIAELFWILFGLASKALFGITKKQPNI